MLDPLAFYHHFHADDVHYYDYDLCYELLTERVRRPRRARSADAARATQSRAAPYAWRRAAS